MSFTILLEVCTAALVFVEVLRQAIRLMRHQRTAV
jgi:hypothetical protein